MPTVGLVVVVAVTCLLAVPLAGAKKPPPSDHGFPLDQYLRGLIAGKIFVGGSPPKIVGAKTKDAVFVVDGRAHYQPQLALRRAGRDDGKGRFLILRARSWGSALAHVIQLDPGIVKFFRIAFPKAIGGKPFPPLYAGITYAFEVAADAPTPKFEAVQVASTPHPDPALRRAGVTLVTLKRGLTPGGYLVRVSAEVGLRPHPLKTLYDAYENATGAVEWITIALAPGEVALEKLVDKALEKLVEQAAKGDPRAAAALSTQALREKVVKKRLEEAVKTALTKTELVAKFEVPTVVPELRGLTKALAEQRLQERFLRYTWLEQPTTSSGLAGRVKSQSFKAGQKVKVGTRVRVRLYTAVSKPQPTTTPPPPATQLVTFANPLLLDRIKILGAPYEPFRVWACNPATTGSCDKSNSRSDIHTQARAFCQRSVPSGQPGSRIGADQTYYRLEAPDPGETTTVPAGTKWVAASNGFVSRSAPATVFSLIRCQRS